MVHLRLDQPRSRSNGDPPCSPVTSITSGVITPLFAQPFTGQNGESKMNQFKRNNLPMQIVSLMREDETFSVSDLTLLGFRFIATGREGDRIKLSVSQAEGGTAQVLADEAGIITRVFR